MEMVNYVVGLIQQIHDAEVAVAGMRDLLDVAWQKMLAEGKLLPGELPRQPPILLELNSQGEVVHLPQTSTNADSSNSIRPI